MQKTKKLTTQENSAYKTAVLKGQENERYQSNVNANMMAEIEAAKNKEESLMKKEKIESFMNSTKMNASKLYKERVEKKQDMVNEKKVQLEKQKQLKQKYTIVSKKQPACNKKKENGNEFNEQVQKIQKKPVRMQQNIDWKTAERVEKKGIHIPEEMGENWSESQASGYDSQIQVSLNENPQQILKNRTRIRSIMLQKMKA